MTTPSLTRFSVSMPVDLVKQLDRMVTEKGCANRSQALAELVRDGLIEHRSDLGSQEIAGTITLVYDHHKPNIQKALTEIQHKYGNLIIATLHVHLDHHNCMEVLTVRGRAGLIKKAADQLMAVKGMKHGKLTVTTTGKEFGKSH